MTAPRPSTETLHTALALAVRAPSVHNTQPWRWRIGQTSLHLYADQSLHLPHTDPDSRDLIISCGAALHHCQVALAALGWHGRIRRFPNSADPSHLASIEYERRRSGEMDIALAAAIPRRRTDRRLFSGWPVARGDIALMGARVARMGVTMRRVDPYPELRSTLERAVRAHVDDPAYLTELAMWSGRHVATAGVPARNTPQSEAAATVPGRVFAGPMLAQPPDADVEDDNGVLLALGTADDDGPARLRAGEATSVVLLTATALGLATCPVTEVLELPETRESLQASVFGVEAHPQMLIRVGWAPINAEPLPATPRRPLTEVVSSLEAPA